jgi:hypothetical protein
VGRTAAGKLLRWAAAFVGNFLTAIITTRIFEADFSVIYRARTAGGMLEREYIFGALLAFALGYFVYHKWRSGSAKWVWIAGALLFVREAVAYWHEQRYSVLASQPSFMSVVRAMFGPVYISQTIYALVLTRTLSYSAGAWICWSGVLKQSLTALRSGGSRGLS